MLIFTSVAPAATLSATFVTFNYPFFGGTHIAVDLNGDGKLDLAGSGSNSAAVMLNNGDGTFQPKVQYPVAGATQAVAAGDFNSDGRVDLVATINSPQISLALLPGNGDGTFNAPIHFPNTSGFDSPDVVATDLNNDGKLDVVILHSIACFTAPCVAAEVITVMLGNGDGTFRQSFRITENATSAPQNIAVADFNLDGLLDIARAMGDGTFGLMEIANGNGDGTFQAPVRYLVPPDRSSLGGIFIIASDFNGDNRPDVALSVGGASAFLNVLINTTGGGTTPPTPTPPAAPALLSPANKAELPLNQSVPFSWSAVAGAATYEIQFDDSSSFSAPLVAAQTGLTQTHTTQTFTSERRFWWRVRARTAGGINSAWSSVREFDIKRDAPPLPTPTRTPTATSPSSTPTVAPPTSTATQTPTPAPATATSVPASPTATRTATSVPPSATPPQVATDTVSIQLAEYAAGKAELRVEATGSNASATLSVYVTSTNTVIGTLRNEGGGRYRGDFSWPTNPQSITVRSSFGGLATRSVTLK
jgi:hypothetical protein